MKKIFVRMLCVFTLFVIIGLGTQAVYATSANEVKKQGTQQLVEIKENAEKKLEDYKEEYGSDAYGIAAYILNGVRIYSIPLCFIGIAIGGIYQIIGIRKLD